MKALDTGSRSAKDKAKHNNNNKLVKTVPTATSTSKPLSSFTEPTANTQDKSAKATEQEKPANQAGVATATQPLTLNQININYNNLSNDRVTITIEIVGPVTSLSICDWCRTIDSTNIDNDDVSLLLTTISDYYTSCLFNTDLFINKLKILTVKSNHFTGFPSHCL
jgi:hypothetical protein